MRRPLPLRNLIREFNADPLIGIEAENPFVSCLIRSEVLLVGVTIPVANQNSSTAALGNLTSVVGASGIDDQNLIATGEARDRFSNAAFLVSCDDRRGDQSDAHGYAITETDAEPQAHPCI